MPGVVAVVITLMLPFAIFRVIPVSVPLYILGIAILVIFGFLTFPSQAEREGGRTMTGFFVSIAVGLVVIGIGAMFDGVYVYDLLG